MEKALSQGVQTERNLHLQQQSFTQQQRHSALLAASSTAGRRGNRALRISWALPICYINARPVSTCSCRAPDHGMQHARALAGPGA